MAQLALEAKQARAKVQRNDALPVRAALPKTLPSDRPKQSRPSQQQLDAARHRVRVDEVWRESNLPKRQLALDPDRYCGEEWLAARDRALEAMGRDECIVLLGPSGTGKTQMAVALAARAADKERSVRYVKASDLYLDLREAMQAGKESRRREFYRRHGLLIIDEAGESADTDYESRTLGNIIDHRYDAMRPTVLISKQDRKAFAVSLGDSVVSRLHEAGQVIDCDWPSYRQQRTR